MRHEWDAIRAGVRIEDDEKRAIEDESLKDHQGNERDRLVVLAAFQNTIQPVIEKHLRGVQRVLEVGCGRGFFTKWLAPDWLKERTLSADINSSLLAEAPKDGTFLCASAYRPLVKENSLDAVVGFSSFDSLLFLTTALIRAKQALKPGGKIIFFQDLATDLYLEPGEEGVKIAGWRTIERHYKDLTNDLEQTGFRIVEGGLDNFLEAAAVETREEIQRRVDADFPEEKYPLFVVYDRGYTVPVFSRQTREENHILKKQTEGILNYQNHQEYLEFIIDSYKPKIDLKGFKVGNEDVLEWVRLRYLVAEKV